MAKKKEEPERLKSAFDAARMGGYYRMAPEDIVIPGIDNKAGPDHPLYDVTRRHQIDETLVKDIMENGVREAITVRKDGDRAEIINGRRRVLHTREANKRLAASGQDPLTIPVHLVKPASDKEATLLMIAGNAHALAEDPVDRAFKASKAQKRGATDEEIATHLGVEPRSIPAIIKVLDCSDMVKSAVSDGELPLTAALRMAELPRSEQDALLQEFRQREGKVTVKVASQAVAEKIAEKAAEKIAETQPAKASKAAAGKSDSDDDAPNARTITRGASAAFQPGRKQLRAAIEVMRKQKSEYAKGFVQACKYAMGEEVPIALKTALELEAAEQAEAASAKKNGK